MPPFLRRPSLLLAALVAALLALPGTAMAVEPGVQTHLMWGGEDRADVDRQLDRLAEANATVMRLDVGWASLQQSAADRYEEWLLERLDYVVDGANARGIKPLLTFMETPCWASTAPESLKQGCEGAWWERGVQKYGPADPEPYARAAAFVAQRYGTKLAGLEIWNEPNHENFFKGPDRAGRYAALLKAAYPAIKAAAPEVTVVGGSISECDLVFIEQLYALGIKGHFDAFSIHPYNHDASPLDERPGMDIRAAFLRGVPAVRQLMLAKGDDKPLWLTESGWTTSLRRAEPWASGVSEATQAQFLEAQHDKIREWDYVAVNIWFNLIDTGGDDQYDMDGNYGLLREDGSPKPAFEAFKRAAARMRTGAAPAPVAPKPAAVSAPATLERPLTVTVRRTTGHLVVSGTAPAEAQTVTVRLHRRVGAKKTLKKASYRIVVRPKGKSKTFRRKLPKRLSRKSWKVVATAKVKARRTPLRAEAPATATKPKRPLRFFR